MTLSSTFMLERLLYNTALIIISYYSTVILFFKPIILRIIAA